jgi:hypothetical protein
VLPLIRWAFMRFRTKNTAIPIFIWGFLTVLYMAFVRAQKDVGTNGGIAVTLIAIPTRTRECGASLLCGDAMKSSTCKWPTENPLDAARKRRDRRLIGNISNGVGAAALGPGRGRPMGHYTAFLNAAHRCWSAPLFGLVGGGGVG